MAKRAAEDYSAIATTDDIRPILGALDETKLLEIAELRPTVKDVEVASLWLTGDADIFGAGQPLKGMTMRRLSRTDQHIALRAASRPDLCLEPWRGFLNNRARR